VKNKVQIFLTHLPDALDPKLERALVGTLSRVEQDRFDKIKSQQRRQQFLVGHLLLARLESIHKSLSHSGDVVAVAGFEHPVGIDVEKMEAREYQDQIAERMFAPEDLATYRNLDGPPKVRRFFELWTLHEARLKAGAAVGDKQWRTYQSEPKEGYMMSVVAKTDREFSCDLEWVIFDATWSDTDRA